MSSVHVHLDRNGALSLSGTDHDAVLCVSGEPRIRDAQRDLPLESRAESGASQVTIRWNCAVARGTVTVSQLSGWIKTRLELNCTRTFQSTHVGWDVRMRAAKLRVLNDRYRLQPVDSPVRIGAMTPFVARAEPGQGHLAIVGSESVCGYDWCTAGGWAVGTVWLDRELAHPRFTFEGPQLRNWHNRYTVREGQRLCYEWTGWVSDQPPPIVVPGRYPSRMRAALSITDHADYDSCERLAALWHGHSDPQARRQPGGFVGLGLPFTKSVFPATPADDGPGLHNPAFAELCRVGYRAGIEICPHGVHSLIQPEVSELDELLGRFDEFRPRTWTDHGNHFFSNYGRRGWDPEDEYSLHGWLDRLGIEYVWGRVDFGHALPGGQLDQLAVESFRGWSYMRDLPRSVWRSVTSLRPWAALHAFSVLAYQLLPEPTMLKFFRLQRDVQQLLRGNLRFLPAAIRHSAVLAVALLRRAGLREMWSNTRYPRREISCKPVFFPEHHSTSQKSDDQGSQHRWLFNTVAVHDVQQAYSATSAARLIDEYGIHIAHTYLGSVSRAHLGHAMEPTGPVHWKLTDQFAANLQQLARLRDAGKLWVAPMGEMGDFWAARQQVVIRPVPDGNWEIHYRSEQGSEIDLQLVILGGTRLCGHELPSTELMHDDAHFTSVRLPPGSAIRVAPV